MMSRILIRRVVKNQKAEVTMSLIAVKTALFTPEIISIYYRNLIKNKVNVLFLRYVR